MVQEYRASTSAAIASNRCPKHTTVCDSKSFAGFGREEK
jgi:hypothetical protein